MKLELLSDNLILILNKLINNQNLCKLIYYNSKNPLEEADIVLPANNFILSKIFPYPYDTNTLTEDCSQIRIWFPKGEIDNSGSININDIFLDVLVSKKLYLININYKPKIRPYEIMKEIISTFDGNSIETLGILHFKKFYHLTVNEQFDIFRLQTDMTLFS